VDLETNDVETGTGKNFDHTARSQIREFEIVRFNQDERFLDFCVGGEID
jgi:hypothetical protein